MNSCNRHRWTLRDSAILEIAVGFKTEETEAKTGRKERSKWQPKMSDIRQLYADFDPAKYHKVYYSELDPEVQFFLQQLHQIFSEG